MRGGAGPPRGLCLPTVAASNIELLASTQSSLSLALAFHYI